MSNSSRIACSFAPAYFHHWRSKARMPWSRSESVVAHSSTCTGRAPMGPPSISSARAAAPPPRLASNDTCVIQWFTRPEPGRFLPIRASLPPVAHRPLSELMSPGWARVLAPAEGQIRAMGAFLRGETRAGRPYCPPGPEVLRAFQDPFEDVRVLVLGQDPYPTPGHAMGRAFSVRKDVTPLPRSLVNIFTELSNDVGVPTPANGDLSPWAAQGVLLLNTSLTVQAGIAGSHRGRGWESVTALAVDALVARGG